MHDSLEFLCLVLVLESLHCMEWTRKVDMLFQHFIYTYYVLWPILWREMGLSLQLYENQFLLFVVGCQLLVSCGGLPK